MEARSIAKYVRVSPRKAGQVCSLVRGKNVDEALAILKFTPRGAADIIAKVVKSAKANAENNHEMDACQPLRTAPALQDGSGALL